MTGTIREFRNDQLRDHAAALTYYSMLSIFPTLLLLVSILGLFGHSVLDRLITKLQGTVPGTARTVLVNAVKGLEGNQRLSTWTAVIGVVLALWAASRYMAAFMRAANAVYDIAEGRSWWTIARQRLVMTVSMVLVLVLCAVTVVFSGGLAARTGSLIGLSSVSLEAWRIAKWPLLLFAVVVVLALLYWRAPNVRFPWFRVVTPGSAVAVTLWMAASGLFAVYVSNFSSYNKTYGSLAAVIVFLIWLWLTNLAVLLGAEFDAELHRQRAEAAGLPPGQEPYLPLRDTTALTDEQRQQLPDVPSGPHGRED